MILVVIDSHSKWIETYPTDSSTSSKVIEVSRTLFAQFGLPEVLVADNGASPTVATATFMVGVGPQAELTAVVGRDDTSVQTAQYLCR